MSTRAEVDAAIARLELPSLVCRALPDTEGQQVFQRALDEFVGSDDRRWWWEAFTKESVVREVADGWRFLATLAPNSDSLVWFIVEDTDLPFYSVYEATPAAVEGIVGECFAFEYYLVAKDMSWLLCENHHNKMIAIGEPVAARLAELRAGS